MKTFQQILRDFRVGSASEREKGGKFERLMRGYLLTSPTYATTMKTVWLWNEFPFRSQFGGSDLGIDLVAQTYENEFWAIQYSTPSSTPHPMMITAWPPSTLPVVCT